MIGCYQNILFMACSVLYRECPIRRTAHQLRYMGVLHMMKWLSCLIMILCLLLVSSDTRAENPINKGERLGIRRCIDLAIANHPSINAARNTIRVNESRIGQAKANYYPQISAQTGYNRISPSSGSTTSLISRGDFDQYEGNLNLSQNIYDFGKTSTQVRIQSLNTESSRQDLSSVEEQVILGVKQSYYASLHAERNLEVARESVKQFQHHLDQAKGFFDVGIKPKFDVTKAEVDLSNAKLALIKADNALRIARVNLNNAMGMPDAPEYTLEDSLLFETDAIDVREALKKAYEARPDLRSLITKVDAGKQSLELAKKGYYPYVTGNANWGYDGQQFPLDKTWNVGAALNIPLFSGFLTKNQVGEAEATLDVLKANEQSLRLQIRLEVEQAYSSLVEAMESISTAQIAVRQAEENVDLANGRYAAGVGNPIEVTDALVALSTAKTNHISALTGYKTAQANLEKAMGLK